MDAPRDDHATDERLDAGSWLVSVAFWLCLFGCAAVYAGVALSPKLVAYLELRREYIADQHRLVALERRNQHLERVATALETDPHFAEELLRVNLDAAEPGEERIAVDPSHHLRVEREAVEAAEIPAPWYLPVVRLLAEDDGLRRRLLVGTAVTVVLAFALLHDANGPIFARISGGTRAGFVGLLRLAAGRYRRTTDADATAENDPPRADDDRRAA